MSFNKDVNTYYVITSNNDEFGIGYYTGISKVREKKSAVFSSLEDYRVKKYKTKNRAEIELKKIKEIAKGEYSIIEIKK